MWRLSIEDDEANRTVVNLVRKEYSIGRAEENSVRLTERNVSRLHAVLRRTTDGWVIEDLRSQTGSFVNERRVDGTQPIDHRDKIRIGDYDISLLDSEREAEEASVDKQTETVPSAAEGDEQLDRHDRLVVVEGPNPGTQYPLTDKKMLLGRGEECDIALQDTSVSRVHASLTRDEHGRFHVSDQKSSNGVRVNGMEITKIPLYAGDVVELGDVHLQFVPKGSRFDETAVRAGVQAAAVSTGANGSNKLWLALGALALVGIVIWAAPERHEAEPSVATPVVSEDALVEQAEALAAAHDFDGAVALVRGLEANSPAKANAKYRSIVNGWADAQFQRVESVSDQATQQALLQSIVDFIDVDPNRRARAQAHIDTLNRPAEPEVGDSSDGTLASNTGLGAPSGLGMSNVGLTTAPSTAPSTPTVFPSSAVPPSAVPAVSTAPLQPQVNIAAARPVYVAPPRPVAAVVPSQVAALPSTAGSPSIAAAKPAPVAPPVAPTTPPLAVPRPPAVHTAPAPVPSAPAGTGVPSVATPSNPTPAPSATPSAAPPKPAAPTAAPQPAQPNPPQVPPQTAPPQAKPAQPTKEQPAPAPPSQAPVKPSPSTSVKPTTPAAPAPPVVNWPGATP